MADIVTGTVSGTVDMTSLLQGQAALLDATKTAAWANSDRTGTEADRVVAQDTAYFIANQTARTQSDKEVARSQAWTEATMNTGFAKIASDQQLATAILQGTVNTGNMTTLAALIQDGASTRMLMNQLHADDLNRKLIERNAEIVEARGDHRFYGLSNQINALHSQFQAAAQKTVNFGTMGANTQSSTNNVA